MYETAEPVPRAETRARIAAFQAALRAHGVDVALIQQNTDLFYLTGSVAQGILAVPAEGDPVFFAKRPFERTRRDSSLQPVEPFTKDPVGALRTRGVVLPAQPKVGLELEVIPYSWAMRNMRSSQVRPEQLVDVFETLRGVRAVKSDWERRMHRQAAVVLDKTFAAVPDLLKEGMREINLKARLELVMRENGSQGITPQRRFNQEPFQGHVLSGDTACLASYQDSAMGGVGVSRRYPQDAGFKKIRRGEPIIIDFAAAYNGYLADETRTFAIGNLTMDLKEKYELTVEILDRLRAKLVPGADGGSLYALAEEEFGRRQLLDNLGGLGEDRIKFIGHGIGIELDELPVLAEGVSSKIEIGNVVAVEPKLVFKDVGMVGVEDSHFITDAGADVFTKTRYDTLG